MYSAGSRQWRKQTSVTSKKTWYRSQFNCSSVDTFRHKMKVDRSANSWSLEILLDIWTMFWCRFKGISQLTMTTCSTWTHFFDPSKSINRIMSAATLFLLLIDALFSLQLHVPLQLLLFFLHLFLVIWHHQFNNLLKDAIDVSLLFSTAVDKSPTTLEHPFCLLVTNLFLINQISFIPDENNARYGLTVILELCDPILDSLERSPVRYIKDDDYGIAIPIIELQERSVPFLSSCVPNLPSQIKYFETVLSIFEGYVFLVEASTEGWLYDGGKFAVDISLNNACLSDA